MTPSPDPDPGRGAGLPGTTPGPWSWIIHDGSMASLVGPGEMRDHVLSVSPCRSCVKDEWEWGRCTTPSERDADLLAATPSLLAALQGMVALWDDLADGDTPARHLAPAALAAARQAIATAAPSASRDEGSSRAATPSSDPA